jgi:hypothetical protein
MDTPSLPMSLLTTTLSVAGQLLLTCAKHTATHCMVLSKTHPNTKHGHSVKADNRDILTISEKPSSFSTKKAP